MSGDMIPFKTDAWFSGLTNDPIGFKTKTDEIISEETVLRAEKIILATTRHQSTILRGIMQCNNKLYNFGIDIIRGYLRRGEIVPTAYVFKQIAKHLIPKELYLKARQLGMTSVMFDYSLIDPCLAFHSSMELKRQGFIKRFRMRYRREGVMCICITKNAFTKNGSGFDTSILGPIKAYKIINGKKIEVKLDDIKHECRLILRDDVFYLHIPRDKNKIMVRERKETGAVDPGARKAGTIFDGEYFTILCDNSKKLVDKLISQLCYIKNCKIWSLYQERNMQKHVSKMDDNESSSEIVIKLFLHYPNEIIDCIDRQLKISRGLLIEPKKTSCPPVKLSDEEKRRKLKQKKRNARNRKNKPRKRPGRRKKRIKIKPFRYTNRERQLNRVYNETQAIKAAAKKNPKPKKQPKKGTKVGHMNNYLVKNKNGNDVYVEREINLTKSYAKHKLKLQDKISNFTKILEDHASLKHKKAITANKKANIALKKEAKSNKLPFIPIPNPILEEFIQKEFADVKPSKRHNGIIKKNKQTRSLETKMKRKNKRLRRKMSNLQKDLHNKSALFYARNFVNIPYGDLSTRGIVNKGGNLDAFTKKWFSFLSNFKFTMTLKAKCEQYNSNILMTDEYRTSKACSNCGELNDVGSNETYVCSSCDLVIDRDHNGAKNIMKVHKGEFIHKRFTKKSELPISV